MIKKPIVFLALFIYGTSIVTSEDDSIRLERKNTIFLTPYEVVISLGDICQVARQLSLNRIRGPAFPFDWIFAPFDSLYSFLAYEGLFFLDKDKIIFVNDRPSYLNGSMKFIEDTFYRFQFLHDFELSPFFLKNYNNVKQKYDRRVRRLLDVLHSQKKVLFVRRCISYQQAIALDDLLHSRYPQLNYTILALDSTEEIKMNWGLERVRNFYLRELNPWSWEGDASAWKEILSQFNVLSTTPED